MPYWHCTWLHVHTAEIPVSYSMLLEDINTVHKQQMVQKNHNSNILPHLYLYDPINQDGTVPLCDGRVSVQVCTVTSVVSTLHLQHVTHHILTKKNITYCTNIT